ncbi:unnamed protein product [Rhizoctonia solani]|uniref:Laminin domain protein n=1 Tax=Rhizoctonia solani TaxID=456999 RepID=A0A8H3ALA1_9AGAM|nr:unnamed protein product [Rhizoctonia solani]
MKETYTPPSLPEYITRSHTLKAIVGVPTAEEVEAIHDVIRAVNSVSIVPAMYDPKLSTRLSQYLFTVQMAVYRNEFAPGDNPRANIYTPPSIPSHIPISLKPVVGVPSDDELETVHNAVRTLEGLASSRLFDSKLNVKLSQHLFNLQFARHIEDSNRGDFAQAVTNPVSSQANEGEPSADSLEPISDTTDQQGFQGVPPIETTSNNSAILQEALLHGISELISTLPSNDTSDKIWAALQGTNQRLDKNKELLQDIARTLATTQILTFRASQPFYHSYGRANKQGELAWMHKLPYVSSNDGSTLGQNISKQDLVAYLKFYGIDSGLVEGYRGGELIWGKWEEAQNRLAHYIYYGRPN